MAGADAVAMERRLSVNKSSSSSKISKPSTTIVRRVFVSSSAAAAATAPPPPPPPPSSRAPSTFVTIDLRDFPRVVQKLTGTPPRDSPPSWSPRPNSRLRSIAPPPLRSRPQQHLRQQRIAPQAHPSLPMRQGLGSPHKRDVLPPPMQYPPKPAHPAMVPSPRLFSPLPVLTPGDDSWANPIDAMAISPRLVSDSQNGALPPPLPCSSYSEYTAQGLAGFVEQPPMDLMHPRPALASSGRGQTHASANGHSHPHLPSSMAPNPLFASYSRFSPSWNNHDPLYSPNEKFLHSPPPLGQARLPASPHDVLPPLDPPPKLPPLPSSPSLLPLSPVSTSILSPTSSFSWLPPWPPSPYLSPPSLSPSIFLRSPTALSPFVRSPTVCSFQANGDHSGKPY